MATPTDLVANVRAAVVAALLAQRARPESGLETMFPTGPACTGPSSSSPRPGLRGRGRSARRRDPGEIALQRTPDGVQLSAVTPTAQVEEAADGLPVLRLGRTVTNDEVLAGIEAERSDR